MLLNFSNTNCEQQITYRKCFLLKLSIKIIEQPKFEIGINIQEKIQHEALIMFKLLNEMESY